MVAGDPQELEPGYTDDPANWNRVTLRWSITHHPALALLGETADDEIEWDPSRRAYGTREQSPTCAVSRHVLDDGGFPAHARREEPAHERDSGWSFLAGIDAEQLDGYGDAPENWRHVTLADLVEQFPDSEPIFTEPVGSELAWNPVEKAFRITYAL